MTSSSYFYFAPRPFAGSWRLVTKVSTLRDLGRLYRRPWDFSLPTTSGGPTGCSIQTWKASKRKIPGRLCATFSLTGSGSISEKAGI